MLEQKIQTKILVRLEKEGWLVNKLMHLSRSGWPDIIAHKDGRTVYIEVKRPGGRLSEIQKYVIAKLRKEGITVIVTDNVDHAIGEINVQ